jgi:hypothetical protein
MRRVTKLSAAAVVLVVTGGGAAGAYAQWRVPSKAISIKLKSVDMPRGARPSVAKSGADAIVSWSPQEIDQGTAMQAYIVKRHNADDDSVAAAFAPTAALTVTEKNVTAGKWYWTITPKFALWTGAKSKPSEKLKFQAPPAGAAANILVSAPKAAVTGTAPTPTTDVEVPPTESAKPAEGPTSPAPTPTQTAPTTPTVAESTPSPDTSPLTGETTGP